MKKPPHHKELRSALYDIVQNQVFENPDVSEILELYGVRKDHETAGEFAEKIASLMLENALGIKATHKAMSIINPNQIYLRKKRP